MTGRAVRGAKSRFGSAQMEALAGMLARGLSQAECARALGTTQQTVSRLARRIEAQGGPLVIDGSSPAAFVASFDKPLPCLQACVTEYLQRLEASGDAAIRWRDAVLKAYSARFRPDGAAALS